MPLFMRMEPDLYMGNEAPYPYLELEKLNPDQKAMLLKLLKWVVLTLYAFFVATRLWVYPMLFSPALNNLSPYGSE